ncbi:MAG: transposase family protein [Cyanobacteria bacterium P01_D01_bin.50]
MFLPDGKDIIDVVASKRGPKSDVKLFRESRKGFDPNQIFNGNKTYQGEELTKTPHKKPKKQELTPEQKSIHKEYATEPHFC